MNLIGLAIMTFMACEKNAKSYEAELMQLQSHPIVLPLNKMECLFGRGVNVISKEIVKSKLKMVVYVDTTECSPCTLDKMFLWNDLLMECDSLYGNTLKFVFIFAPKQEQIEDARFSVESSGLASCVYLDTAYTFRNVNPNMSQDRRLHSFLLNDRDSVILVGNPLENQQIRTLLIKIVNEIIQRNENKRK